MCPYALSPDSTELQAGDVSEAWGWGGSMVGAALTTCPCIGEWQIAKRPLQRVAVEKADSLYFHPFSAQLCF